MWARILLALLLWASPAAAQYVPLNSIPIGQGPGVIGWSSIAPGANGCVITSNGTTFSCANPTFVQPSLAQNNIWVGNSSAVATAVSLGGDCTLVYPGTITCTKTSGAAFTAYATQSVPCTVAQGCTGATSASGTSLDNITGFSATGFLIRTGAGTYAFQSTVNGITFGNLAQLAGLSVLGVTGTSTANMAAITGTANQFLQVNSAQSALLFVTMTGDCSLLGGAITCTKTNAVAFGPLATQAAPCTVAQGCTGATTASGTSVDNISGFSSTGFLTRTGAGTYAFQSTTNGITNANLVQSPAVTFKGNPTSSTANATDFTVNSLTALGSPDANNDYLVVWDHTAGTLKKITPGTIASVATSGVSSLNGLTGALSIAAASYNTVAAAGSTVTVGSPLVGAFAGAAFGGL